MVTHRTREDLLGDNGGTFTFDGLEAAAKRAKDAAGDKDVWVLGAAVARQLLRAGLLNEVRIQLVPLLMGEGTPLFAGGRAELIPVGEPVAGADFEAAAVGKVRPWSAPTGARQGSSNTEPLSDHPRPMICLPTPAWAATASVLSLR